MYQMEFFSSFPSFIKKRGDVYPSFPCKLKLVVTCYPAIPFLGIYTKEIKSPS